MRKILLSFLFAGLMAACSGAWSPHADEARKRAEQCAAKLIAIDRTDTLGMERCVIEAKAVQGEYDLMGDSVAVIAFDEAYEAYLKQHDKKLAEMIFPSETNGDK